MPKRGYKFSLLNEVIDVNNCHYYLITGEISQ